MTPKPVIAALVLAAATLARAQTAELRILAWTNAIDPAVVASFEKAHGCKVVVDTYTDEARLLGILRSGATNVDVVAASDQAAAPLIEEGLFSPLRAENLPNATNVEARFAGQSFDPANRFTQPFRWGTVGIYMRPKDDNPVNETWGLVFDPVKQPGPPVLLDSMRPMCACAAKYVGEVANATDAKGVVKVRRIMQDAFIRAAGLESPAGGRDLVLAKKAALAVTRNNEAVLGMEKDPATVYFVPREGSVIWIDSLAVPKLSPHRDLAEQFINYTLGAEVSGPLAAYSRSAAPSRSTRSFVDKKLLDNPAVYPPAEIYVRLEFLHDVGEFTKLYEQIWASSTGNKLKFKRVQPSPDERIMTKDQLK